MLGVQMFSGTLNKSLITGVSLRICSLIRYDMRCCFNVHLKADLSQLRVPHGIKNTPVLSVFMNFGWFVHLCCLDNIYMPSMFVPSVL